MNKIILIISLIFSVTVQATTYNTGVTGKLCRFDANHLVIVYDGAHRYIVNDNASPYPKTGMSKGKLIARNIKHFYDAKYWTDFRYPKGHRSKSKMFVMDGVNAYMPPFDMYELCE